MYIDYSYMDKEEIKEYEALDKIDLLPYLKENRNQDIYKVKECIESDHCDCIFDYIADYDFAAYLNDRYGSNSIEEMTVYCVNNMFGRYKGE